MAVTVTMLQTRRGEDGNLWTAGSSYSASDAFAQFLITHNLATGAMPQPAPSALSAAEVAAVRTLVAPDGSAVLAHPRTYFHGFAGGQTSEDGVFFDIVAGNHGVFGANLSRAQAWANRAGGYVSTVDPAAGVTDSVIRIPAPNFDYAGGESLLVMWSGQVTPEGSDTTVMGTSFGSSASGVRIRAKSTGQLDFALYQAGGANAFSSATTNNAAGKPFVSGEAHSFAIWVNGQARKHAMWVDGVINVAEATFGGGVTIDTTTTNTWNIGAGSASPGGTEGIATKTAGLVILRFAATDGLPTIAEIGAVVAQWRANMGRPILPGSL